MKLVNINHNFNYETEKLVRLFFPFEKIEVTETDFSDDNEIVTRLCSDKAQAYISAFGKKENYSVNISDKDTEKARELAVVTALFYCLEKVTGYRPKWGMLTGIRPAKLYSGILNKIGKENADNAFLNKLFVSEEKLSLCKQTYISEKNIIDLSTPSSVSLYISIPFCPTRCSYCSFVSHSVEKSGKLIEDYISLLLEEIELTGEIVKKCNLRLETVYIGGGTPTTLSHNQLKTVIEKIRENFDFSSVREFTVEAGRPDTVTREKLLTLKHSGVGRISINPQTMNDEILEIIGRKHTSAQTKEAFALAKSLGFDNINMDLIAGLPNETFESFKNTVQEVLKLNPESVTVHSLSLKRASDLNGSDIFNMCSDAETADKMVSYARSTLERNNILPYYMYRQSKTVGNLENVGYAKKGFECLYNVFIMDETHSVIACGASAVTKLKQPNGNHIERIFNFKYPYEYISHFDEIKERKKGILNFYEKYR